MNFILTAIAVTVVAFVVDGVFYSFIFTKGTRHLTSMTGNPTQAQFMQLMGMQLVNTLVFALTFAYFYLVVRTALPYPGATGGILFGALAWAPTVLHIGISNSIWYDQTRMLANNTVWTSLVKFVASGLVLGLMLT